MKRQLLCLALLAVGVIATGSPVTAQTPPASGTTSVRSAALAPDPALQVQHLVQLFRAGDIPGIARAAVPPAQWDKIRTAWERERLRPITDAERAEFAQKLAEVTAPDAVDQLMAQIEPKLAEARPQVPGALLMGFGAAQMALGSPDSDLTDEQRVALKAALPGVQTWAVSTDFLSSNTMRDALSLLTDAARRAGIQNLDQLRALSLEELLRRGNGILAAAKDAAQLYGVDADAIADSLQVDVLENDGQTAKVRTTVTVFGAPVFADHDLVLVDGQWYGKNTNAHISFDDDEDDSDDAAVEG